jgi:hypothetical protein
MEWKKVNAVTQAIEPVKNWALVWQLVSYLLGLRAYAPTMLESKITVSFWTKASESVVIFVNGTQVEEVKRDETACHRYF